MKNVESENGEILHSTFFILHLKCSGFQPQTSPFVKTKHQVHVLYGLTHGTFEEVVNHGSDNSLVAKFVDVDESFVCVHHLLEVERLVDVVREGSILVEVLVECSQCSADGLVAEPSSPSNVTTSVQKIPRGKSPRYGMKSTV